MKKIITYGTFDLFHKGHLELIRRAKELGDYLIVAVSTDEFNLEKGKETVISFNDRIEIVKSIRYVDEVIAEKNWDQKICDIMENDIDTFVIGDDWKGKFDYLNEYCNVIYLNRTEGISTTMLKCKLGDSNND
ncbi:glycerol-3-phosphate cytidylyltransferase [Erysipelothrix rhusiopathiae]|uniref:Glycerol-3-phosphate cytidylyltransferase n=1 Tax=Erysipelothrix rhusiopathiae TaxID=1648 RepID=A0A6S6I272_ERYRH|nr:glycerol-3-phosphate cytidylyltransferase [Erysipelothrix rhusiopathiae]